MARNIDEGQPSQDQVDKNADWGDFTETDVLFFGYWVMMGESLKELYSADEIRDFFLSARDCRFLVGEIAVYVNESDEEGYPLLAEIDFAEELSEKSSNSNEQAKTAENPDPHDVFDAAWAELGVRVQKKSSQEELTHFFEMAQSGLPISGAIASYLDEDDEEGIILDVELTVEDFEDECIDDVESGVESGDLDEE